jgi:hypothetical protein
MTLPPNDFILLLASLQTLPSGLEAGQAGQA